MLERLDTHDTNRGFEGRVVRKSLDSKRPVVPDVPMILTDPPQLARRERVLPET